ncbi:MAG TPA: YCF48-related protein [Ignavibacteria bacterium]|nr:YCF48-related protein [Ignavibacteria bacterium]
MKKILFLTIFIASTFYSNLFSQQNTNGWYWLNGKPNGNNLNWAYITGTGTQFAIGNKGTFAASIDGGSNWSINSQVGLSDFALSYKDLRTGYFLDENTGFAAGGTIVNSIAGVVSKTIDGGNTWTNYQYNDTSGSVNGMYFINANTGYICGGTRVRVHKTIDGGLTWTDISNGLSSTNTYSAIYAIDENNIYMAFTTRRLYYTSNGGTSWSLITLPGTTGGTTMADVYFKDVNTGYACGSPNYFAYTTNAGVNWTQNNPSTPLTAALKDITYDGSTLYMIGTTRPYIYTSANDGANWDSVRFYDSLNINEPLGVSVNNVAVRGSNIVIVGANGYITESVNGGSNWTNKNYSVNSGSNFYNSITMKSTNDMWLSSTGGVGSLLHTTNAGANWTTIPSAHSVAIFQLDFPTTDTAYSCAGNIAGSIGQVAKSSNGGFNWVLLPNPAVNHTFLTLDFLNGSTGYVGGGGSGLPANVYKTVDGGATWVSKPLGSSGSVLSVQMLSIDSGYALISSRLYFTSNGGTNWSSPVPPSGVFTNMYVLNSDVVFINGTTSLSSGNALIYKSTNGGSNWINVTGDFPDSLTVNRTRWLNLNDGVAGCTGGLVAKTSNGGLNWSVSNPGFSNISDVNFPEKNLWYSVSNTGTSYPIGQKTDNISSITVNLNVGIEGFWNGISQIADTVTAELRSSVSPFGLVASSSTLLTPNASFGTFEFSSVPAESYYIVVKHRNSIETWSASPISMTLGGNYNYDFTTSASMTFGGNTVLKLGRYCNYSGDVNQDGTIDSDDKSEIENDAVNSVFGYVPTDITGDDAVDASDISLVENNATLGVSVIAP